MFFLHLLYFVKEYVVFFFLKKVTKPIVDGYTLDANHIDVSLAIMNSGRLLVAVLEMHK